jgi:glycosyltransferase involved in cell wall biosynthesis
MKPLMPANFRAGVPHEKRFSRWQTTSLSTIEVGRDAGRLWETALEEAGMPRKRVLISINASWNIYNFRAGLVRGLSHHGYELVAAAPLDQYSERLCELGCKHIDLPMYNKGSSPLRDALLFLRYVLLLRRHRPDIFLGYTIKPNIYGSLAAHLLGIPVINNISGLGTAFMGEGWLTAVVTLLYRLALRSSKTVFFQNEEDRQLFIRHRIVKGERALLLPGSGIDLDKFCPQPANGVGEQDSPHAFLLIARLIWDKGVGEFVDAARLVKRRYPEARFQVLGFLDVKNRAAISREQMDAWVKEGVIEYLGSAEDVRPAIAAASCVVLPSYYKEGTPRTLLEAAAMGKPLITTGMPGCRNVVDDGINGFLCAPRDHKDLAEKLMTFLGLDPSSREQMGLASRRKAEAEYDEQIVVERYLAAVERAAALGKRSKSYR